MYSQNFEFAYRVFTPTKQWAKVVEKSRPYVHDFFKQTQKLS